jgi:hypothetical protein
MQVKTTPVAIPVIIGSFPVLMAHLPPKKAQIDMLTLRATLGVADGSIPDQVSAAIPKTRSRAIIRANNAPKKICRILCLCKKIPPRIESLIDPMREGIFLCW